MTWPTFKGSSNVQSQISMKDRFAGAEAVQNQQSQAEVLVKSHAPFLLEFLNQTLAKGLPLRVVAPLTYESSSLDNDLDDGFYFKRSEGQNSKFVAVHETIHAGTELMFKSVDSALQEILFTDQRQKEYAVPFEAKTLLVTCTDVFEKAQNYLQNQ